MKIIELKNNEEIHNYQKLDKILIDLCKKVKKYRSINPKKYGLVCAAILDPQNRSTFGISVCVEEGKWMHAERYAMMKYKKKFGEIPDGSICITTCSPCSEHMPSRYLESCTDLINNSNIKKVYAGYMDPTQHEEQRTFNIIETSNVKIRNHCKKIAAEFLNDEEKESQS
jgi:pyrimidine deaminase RibD-like protein